MKKHCSVDACPNISNTRGLCKKHYLRTWRGKDVLDDRTHNQVRYSFDKRVATFWSKVSQGDECWEWQGCRNPRGYGQFPFLELTGERRPFGAHRIAWMLNHGPQPTDQWVLHHCDNPPCVRPDHLYLGTSAENIRDKVVRHRVCSGRAPFRKLTEDQVRTIRALKGTISGRKLAPQYGVSPSTVHFIWNGDRWGHLP